MNLKISSLILVLISSDLSSGSNPSEKFGVPRVEGKKSKVFKVESSEMMKHFATKI